MGQSQVPPDRYPDGLDPKVLGERIAEACDGRTQAWLADEVGVDRATVNDWKRGRHRPTPDHLRAIAKATGKPLAFFTGLAVVGCFVTDGYGHLSCPWRHHLHEAHTLISITAQTAFGIVS